MPDKLDTALDAVFGDQSPEEQEQPDPETAEEEAPDGGSDDDTVAGPEKVEEEAPAEESEPPKLYGGKYKTVEEMEEAHSHLERKLGEQGNELGELRGLREEFQELRTSLDEAKEMESPPVSDLPDWLTAEALEKPDSARRAAIWVAKNQPHNLEPVMDAWYELAPRHASAFDREVEIYELRKEFEEKLEPVAAIPERLQASEQQQQNAEAFNQVWAGVKAQNPDLEEFAEEIVTEARSAPELAAVFQGGSSESQERVLTTLLRSARYRRTEAEDLGARQSQEASEEAKAQAKVVSATSTKGRKPAAAKSQNDEILEIFDRAAGFTD